MECKFYVKLKGYKRSIKEVLLMIGILGFIVAISIGVFLRIYYYLSMLVPMFYLIVLFSKIRRHKNMLVDSIIYLKFENEFFFISEMTLDEKTITKEKTNYKNIKEFNVYENGNVIIETSLNRYNFWIKKEDKKQLSEILHMWIGKLMD